MNLLSTTLEHASRYFSDIRSHSLKAEGFTYSYLEAGHGNPVLFLHGLAANKSVWRSTMTHLKSRYRIISLDIPGISILKQLPNKRMGLHYLANWLETFIREMQLKNVQLVGLSLSAALCAYYAARPNSDIKSLTLMSLPQWYSSPAMKQPTLFYLLDELDRSSAPPIDIMLNYLFYKKPTPPLILKKMGEMILMHHRPEIEKLLEEFRISLQQLPPRLLQINCDVLLVNGQYDRFQSQDLHDDLQKYLPNAKRIFIPNSGHIPHVENSTATLQALDKFLL